MENASKALIIAGAILLSILLISLGIMIFGQAQDTIGNSGMSKAEISTYNSQFTKYEGDSVKGSEVKSLIQEANASNASDSSEGTGRSVTVKVDGKATTTTSGINTAKRYNVKCGAPDTKTGYITTITITTK